MEFHPSEPAPIDCSPAKMDVRQLLKNLKNEAECPLCLDTLKDPKTLPCLHSFCLVCIDKHAHCARRQLQTTISCPVCLTRFQIPEGDTFAGLPASFQIFSPEGKYIREFGKKGPGAERLGVPSSVTFTLSGDVIVSHYISSSKCHMLSLFSESGQLIKNITNKYVRNPYGVSIGSDGQLIVCDNGDETIKVLSPDGTDLLQSFTARDGDKLAMFAIYHQDKFFASYSSASCVKVFDKEGVLLYKIGSKGSADGQFWCPEGLVVDRFNNCLIVCDRYNRRLQAFTVDGKFVTKIGGQHTELEQPRPVAVSNDGNMFVTDKTKQCVHVFH